MKDIQLKLISELMKNCRRSDRELAKVIGVSQPTVSRLIKKLDKEEYIEEYTAIPNLRKLGYEIMAITLMKLRKALSPEEIEEARKKVAESLAEGSFEVIMLERGMGLGYDEVCISYHEDFSSYSKQMDWLKQFTFLNIRRLDSFLINLNDKIHIHRLTFKTLAEDLLKTEEKRRNESQTSV
jgi:DNA-binding Lrp family transcriptional regulator